MEKELIKDIIRALKRLIKKLESGDCDSLTPEQLKELNAGFKKILNVERGIDYDFTTNDSDIWDAWRSLLRSILSFGQKGPKDKSKE